MDDNKLTMVELGRGYELVARTYMEFKELAEEQIRKDNIELCDADLDEVIIGLLVTKILVLEGKLDEKYWRSAISQNSVQGGLTQTLLFFAKFTWRFMKEKGDYRKEINHGNLYQ